MVECNNHFPNYRNDKDLKAIVFVQIRLPPTTEVRSTCHKLLHMPVYAYHFLLLVPLSSILIFVNLTIIYYSFTQTNMLEYTTLKIIFTIVPRGNF